MRTSKRYSNATITKRVDHEAGRHRPPRALAEPATCSRCGAIYSARRWVSAYTPRKSDKQRHWRPAKNVLCPACKQLQEGVPAGFVYLDGAFMAAHQDEVERLLRNETERAAVNNPLARIMSLVEDEKGRLTVTTTTEHLAERLGWAIESAFNGEVRFDFSHENKLARVYWHLD